MILALVLGVVFAWLAVLTMIVVAGGVARRRPDGGAPHFVLVQDRVGQWQATDCRCAIGVDHDRDLRPVR